jgi:hypothetical protein
LFRPIDGSKILYRDGSGHVDFELYGIVCGVCYKKHIFETPKAKPSYLIDIVPENLVEEECPGGLICLKKGDQNAKATT